MAEKRNATTVAHHYPYHSKWVLLTKGLGPKTTNVIMNLNWYLVWSNVVEKRITPDGLL